MSRRSLTRFGTILVGAGLLLAITLTTARADFNDGVAAMVAGDYDKALKTFVPLAEASDHGYAQYFLARMYADGRGVEKNPATAAKWLRKAAEKGIPDAQYRLGGLYERGEGVPQDMEYAFSWYSVAAHIGNPKADSALKATTQKLGPDELRAAQTLAQDLISKYGKPAQTASQTP